MVWGIDTNVDEFAFDPQLTGALSAGITGKAPSQAETLRRKAFDEAMKRAMGVSRSNRGMSAAAGTRMGLQAQSGLMTEGAQQATMLRAQEYQNAVAQLLAQQQAAQQGYYQKEGLEQQAAMFNGQQNQAFFGSIMNAVGGMGQAAMKAFGSDKRLKEDIKDASDKDMTEFMRALKAKTYKYKKTDTSAPVDVGQGHKGGEVGVMAQDLQKTKLGKKLVEAFKTWKPGKERKDGSVGEGKEGPERLAIRPQAVGAVLGAVGNLNDRLEKVEAENSALKRALKAKK